MHRGSLLLSWLALAALAQAAMADEALGPPMSSARAGSARLSPSGPPVERGPVDPMPGMYHEPEVVPAAYSAQDQFPPEPLGFSAARFNPNPGPIVDPATGPGMSYGPYKSGNFEFYDPDDPDGEAYTTSSGEWLRNGCWYADVGVTYITRSVGVKNSAQLASELGSPVNILAVKEDLGYQPGLDITVGRYLGRDVRNRDHSVEFTFLGLNHWQYGQSITAQQQFIFQDIDPTADVDVFDFSLFQSVDITSDFNSYEFNYRIDRRLGRDRMVYSRDNCWVREATPGWVCSFIPGIRTVFVNERLSWFAENNSGTGQYTVDTHNSLVGPQFAGELFYDYAYWRLGIRGKAGGLVNFTSQSSVVRILDDEGEPLEPNRDEYDKNHSMSFVGGLSFMGEYRFRPNFGIKTSFDLLWVTDLALAQNQLTFFPSSPAEISDSHQLFFNGFTLGLEWYR